MKLTVFLVVAILFLSGNPTGVNAFNKTYCQLDLPPPQNWIPGRNLFPGRVLEGFNKNFSEGSLEDIIQYAQWICDGNSGCTSLIVVSAIPSGSFYNPRSWFGYLFSGPPVSPSDFVRGPPAQNVQNSTVFNAYTNSTRPGVDACVAH
ncbi:hypothetical protein GX48_08221 [Paracoccidioides brasiliensis]|nr:hypothetical protein GX48_08221 [Paracoccidioides brasiliensis]